MTSYTFIKIQEFITPFECGSRLQLLLKLQCWQANVKIHLCIPEYLSTYKWYFPSVFVLFHFSCKRAQMNCEQSLREKIHLLQWHSMWKGKGHQLKMPLVCSDLIIMLISSMLSFALLCFETSVRPYWTSKRMRLLMIIGRKMVFASQAVIIVKVTAIFLD